MQRFSEKIMISKSNVVFLRFLLAALAALCASSGFGADDQFDVGGRARLVAFDKGDEEEDASDASQGGWKVFLVGVNEYEYEDEGVVELLYAENDARAVRDAFLKLGAAPEDVQLVKVPSKSNIERRFDKFLDSIEPGDKAVVFFSGHGFEQKTPDGRAESFFAPNDCNPSDRVATSVSVDRMTARLAASRASIKWMIVDACRNDPRRDLPPSSADVNRLNFDALPDSILLLQSCSRGSFSLEADGCGLFTKSLVEALDPEVNCADLDGDGVATMLELVKYVAKNTNELAKKKFGREQIPCILGNTRDFPIVEGRETDDAVTAKVLFEKANRFADENEYAAARAVMKEVVKLAPNNSTYARFNKLLNELNRPTDPPASSLTKTSNDETANEASSEPSRNAGARKVLTINGVEFAFRWCPPGRFVMGSPDDEDGRFAVETQRETILTKGFWLAETETTQALWLAIMGGNPSRFAGDETLPVEGVSWNDCQEFVKKLNALVLSGAGTFRLPTEDACRAGTQTAYPWGDALNGDKANWDGTEPCGTQTTGTFRNGTTRVGSFDANAWGLFDMNGNVAEWCNDRYGACLEGTQTNPQGASEGVNRVVRGGAWCVGAKYCRSASRDCNVAGSRSEACGFRLAMTDPI